MVSSVVAAGLMGLAGTSLGAGQGATFVETFDETSNVGGWSYFGQPGNDQEIFDDLGGPHGAFLHSPCGPPAPTCLTSFAPRPRTVPGGESVFTGNYRERGVTSVGLDAIIFANGLGTTGNRPMSLVLIHDNGTPTVFDDDLAVAYEGNKNIPQPNGTWGKYDFGIPSDSATMPSDWRVFFRPPDDLTADEVWNIVIEDVSQVMFYHGSLELFYALTGWDIGLDNARITETGGESSCPGDVNGDGLVGGADLSALLGAWGANGAAAGALDLNGNGVVDGADLATLLSRWGQCR